MTDWSAYRACEVCEAKTGDACYTLLGAGPQALPSEYADTPHSSRNLRGAEPARPRTTPHSAGSATPVARRSAAKARSTAASWADVARKQGKI
jgi:hypothetical protein